GIGLDGGAGRVAQQHRVEVAETSAIARAILQRLTQARGEEPRRQVRRTLLDARVLRLRVVGRGGGQREREQDGESEQRAGDDHRADAFFVVLQVYDPGNFSPSFAQPARRTATFGGRSCIATV